MELESQSLISFEPEQGINPVELNTSDGANLLGGSQNEMERAVIIYDTETQQEQVVKVNVESESKIETQKESNEQLDNLDTLNPTIDTAKNEVSENISSKNMVPPKNMPSVKTQETEELDDDETIATFVTSTGQQLALYAVEDSDDIFAVALYDESGIPPTDFHILLKADVERLIGEGAVKTVKKPPVPQNKDFKPPQKKEQIKFEKVHEIKSMPQRTQDASLHKIRQNKTEIIEVPKDQKVQKPPIVKTQHVKLITSRTSITPNKNITPVKQITPKVTKKIVARVLPSEASNKKETKVSSAVKNKKSYSNIDYIQDELDSDAEIIEQSTVQHILYDVDVSDSELTFDDVKASLQNFKMRKPTISINKTKPLEPKKVEHTKVEDKKEVIPKVSTISKNTTKVTPVLPQKKETIPIINRTYKSPKKTQITNNLLLTQKKIKKEVIDPSYEDGFDDDHNSSDEIMKNMSESNSSIIGNSSSAIKIKRSRKQQLTVVNRTDSEIIIQPASAFSEDEMEPVLTKRRGRKKKKLLPDPDYNPRNSAKRNSRSNRSVEVIDIDIDENDRKNIMDGRTGSSKEKGSSDKENDVISIDDSDEDEKSTKKKKLSKPLKKFKCKTCDEAFDIAVALARHVRVVHSPKKRGRPTKNNWLKGERSETTDSEESTEESTPEPEPGPRKRGRPPGKKNLLKSESPVPDIDLKSDTTSEIPSEVRKRGRPRSKKNVQKDRSSTPEPRRRGRPRKSSPIKENRAISPTLNEKVLNSSEPLLQMPRKRGRPSKKSLLKEENSITNAEEKNKSSVETPSEPRKRGRPSKRSMLKNDRSTSPEVVVKTEKIESKPTEKSPSPEPEKKQSLMRSVIPPPKKRKFDKEETTKKIMVTEKLDDQSKNIENTAISDEKKLNEKSQEKCQEISQEKFQDKSQEKSEENSKVNSQEQNQEQSQEKLADESNKLPNSLFETVAADDIQSDLVPNNSDESSKMKKKITDSTMEISKSSELFNDKDLGITMTESETVKADKTLIKPQGNFELSKDKNTETLKLQNDRNILKDSSVEPTENIETDQGESLKDPTHENSEMHIKLECLEEPTVSGEKEEQIIKDESPRIPETEKKLEDEDILPNFSNKDISSQADFSRDKELEDLEIEKQLKSFEESSVNLDQDKSLNTDNLVTSDLKSNEKSNEPVVEQRKRGRPSKDDSAKINKSSIEVNKTVLESKPRAFVRKRGRPSKDESSKNELLLTLELESRVDAIPQSLTECRRKSKLFKDESSKDNRLAHLEHENKNESMDEPLPTPRRRGRPSRNEPPKGDSLLNLELESKAENTRNSTEELQKNNKSAKDDSTNDRLTNLELDIKNESSEESQPKVRKRGRPSKDRTIKDDKEMCLEQNIKVENVEELVVETRKRGRPCKDKSNKEDRLEEEQTRVEALRDTSTECRKKARLDKGILVENTETTVVIKEEIKEEISTDSVSELQTRSRTTKEKTLKDEKPLSSDVGNKNIKGSKSAVVDRKDKGGIVKKFSGSKLKCTDCGKWFSSATSLSTHHLQHRTKKSGQQMQHCSTCKMLIPAATFNKHLTTVHGKSSKLLKVKTIGSLALRRKRLIPVRQVAKIAKISRKSQNTTSRASD